MSTLSFIKMHGLGNDFAVFDARETPASLTSSAVRRIADRHLGVGCDQVIVIEPSGDDLADAAMRVFNADGSEVAACGNAARCVGQLVMEGLGADHMVLATQAGLLDIEAAKGGLISVDMGPARLDWRDIPLREAVDTAHLGISHPGFSPVAHSDGCAVSMGNPHLVFFLEDISSVNLENVGPKLEHHEMFPQRTNVEFVQVLSPSSLRMRVWERGAGVTLACGTGACASVVAAARLGLADRKCDVELDGGTLHVEWMNDDHVMMTGPAEVSFRGALSPDLLRGDV